jgi:putative MATE family efflux protein
MARVDTAGSMTEGPLLGVIARVALPIVLANLLNVTYLLVNALWVGRLGGAAVAAVAASAPLFGVLISLGSGLATAGSVLIAQYAGARRHAAVDHIAAQTLLMVTAVALGFTLMGLLCARPALRLIGVDAPIGHLTAQYLDIAYVGMTPQFLFMAIQGMLQAVGEVRFAFLVMLGSVLLNSVLDPLLIFGLGSWPGWGVAGAATATVIAQLMALALAFGWLLGGRSALHLRAAHFAPDLAHMRRALGIGLPASIEQGTRTFGSVLLMSLAAQFGTAALATYGLGTRLLLFFFVPMLGLSVATATVVGQNIGAGRMDRAAAAGRVCAWASFGILTAIGLLLMPLAPAIMRAMTPTEPTLIAEASRFVRIYAPFLGLFAIPQVMCGVFRGAGSTRQSMGISLTMQWVFQLPSAWLLARLTPLGVLGVWWSYPVGNALASALAVGWFVWGPWRRSLLEPPRN